MARCAPAVPEAFPALSILGFGYREKCETKACYCQKNAYIFLTIDFE